MKTGTVLAMLLLWGGAASATEIVRCTDPATGAVTFSDRACPKGDGELVRFHRGNTSSSAHLREEVERKRLDDEQEAQERRAYSESNQRRIEQVKQQRRQEEWDKICKEAASPRPGSQNRQLTKGQMDILAQCAGFPPRARSTSDDATPPAPTQARSSAPPAPTQPTSAQCDATGCWDNQGNRYNRAGGSGDVHFRQDGQVCHTHNGWMTCP